MRGDANKLEFPDETFDAVISNYVYHNITNAPDKHALLRESLRVLKKGCVFALQDDMKPMMYGDMEAFAKELMAEGFQKVRVIDTAKEIFGSISRANLLGLGKPCSPGRKKVKDKYDERPKSLGISTFFQRGCSRNQGHSMEENVNDTGCFWPYVST